VVSLWFPDWPLVVWTRRNGAPPDGPFALVERGHHGVVLTCPNATAKTAGLRPGQRHADACAMVPGLASRPADPAADAAALAALARWCLRWSPTVAVDQPDGLFLDVGGSAHLFGGMDRLLRDIADRLGRAGIAVHAAIAPTPGAAWAAARFAPTPATVVGDSIAATLARYPVAALRIAPEVAAAARAMSLRSIGDLLALPRAGLARRLRDADGLSVVARLDQLLGHAPEVLAAIEPRLAHVAGRCFAEPLTGTPQLAAALPGLLDTLAGQLARHGLGAVRLHLAGYRIDGDVTAIELRLGASRDPALWARLFASRGLEHLDLGFGIDALALAAAETAPLAEAAPVLSADPPREALPELIDRLGARLGSEVVLTAVPRASWLPERADAWRPVLGAAPHAPPAFDRARPLLLLDPPEPVEAALFEVPDGAPAHFRWRRVTRRIRRAEGPERLSPEWWRGRRPRRTRDYYRVEDESGARFWLFREGLYGWEDSDRAPTWWLHGLFA